MLFIIIYNFLITLKSFLYEW